MRAAFTNLDLLKVQVLDGGSDGKVGGGRTLVFSGGVASGWFFSLQETGYLAL